MPFFTLAPSEATLTPGRYLCDDCGRGFTVRTEHSGREPRCHGTMRLDREIVASSRGREHRLERMWYID